MPDMINVSMAVKVCEGIALALNPELEMAKVAIPVNAPKFNILFFSLILIFIVYAYRFYSLAMIYKITFFYTIIVYNM